MKLDSKIDRVQADLVEIKISQARTDERFNSMDERFKSIDTQLSDIKKGTDTQFADIKVQLRGQDTRLWGFIATLSATIIGFLVKLAFFPNVKV